MVHHIHQDRLLLLRNQMMKIQLTVLITIPKLRIMITVQKMMKQIRIAQHKGQNVPQPLVNQIIIVYHIN
jgi:hypothetical protein